ncbi:hypothetical protein AKJ16_DCAP23410 [Drosera capensis]
MQLIATTRLNTERRAAGISRMPSAFHTTVDACITCAAARSITKHLIKNKQLWWKWQLLLRETFTMCMIPLLVKFRTNWWLYIECSSKINAIAIRVANIGSNNQQEGTSQTHQGSDFDSSNNYSRSYGMIPLGHSSAGHNWVASPYISTPYHEQSQRITSKTGLDPGHGVRGSPYIGRGGSRYRGYTVLSPSSGYSGRRGQGLRVGGIGCGFYPKSMVDDPWKSLNPVKWGEVSKSKVSSKERTPESFQESHSMKKPRVAEEFDSSCCKLSLAEYLADDFDESVDDDSVV